MDAIARYQRQLLDQALQIYHQTPISDATIRAYLATPRHLFVRRYREHASKNWHHVNEGNLQEHLAILYADRPLTLFGDDDENIPSTISQPSFVLRMLDMLQFQPGQKVFELGAGSGWNAALIGQLVGPSGRVCSLEIIPEVAEMAADAISKLGITNVQIMSGDGGDGYSDGAPYDRVTFTAGTYDVSQHFYDQITGGGLLLVVIKSSGGGDNLFVLRKTGDHFESVHSMPCGFVPVTGKYRNEALDPIAVETLPGWNELQDREMARRPFWWGVKGNESFLWQTTGIRSFLSITEPMFRAFKIAKSEGRSPGLHYFGLWDNDGMSLVLAREDELISYGTSAATDCLVQTLHRWVDLGMPTAASFRLEVHRNDRTLSPGQNQWVVKRKESQFLWTLPSLTPE